MLHITPAGMWSVFIVELRSLDSRNVGYFFAFQMSLLFAAFSPDFASCWQWADSRSIGGGILATETLVAGSLSLLAPLKAEQVLWHQQFQDKAGCCTPQVWDAFPPWKYMRRLRKKFLSKLCFTLEQLGGFCAVLPVCYRDIDVEWPSEHLLHYNPRWTQFLLCRIRWETAVGNVRRTYKYHSHFEQSGAGWGNATPQCQRGSCPSEFKKALSKVLEKLCRNRTDSGGIAAGGLKIYCSQLVGNCNKTHQSQLFWWIYSHRCCLGFPTHEPIMNHSRKQTPS